MIITTKEFANLYRQCLVNQMYELMFLTGKNETPKDYSLATKEMRNANITFEIVEDIPGILSLMDVVNKMVKDVTFPFGTSNFYDRKTKMIKSILKNNSDLVTEIKESDNLYNFIIGGFSFHQPKDRYPNAKFDTVREDYVPYGATIEYNKDTYIKCVISISFYLAKNRN